MAIDTKEKRAGVLGVGRPWMRGQFPVAVPDEEWRISVGNAYGGNALSPPIIIPVFVTTNTRVLIAANRTDRTILKSSSRASLIGSAKVKLLKGSS